MAKLPTDLPLPDGMPWCDYCECWHHLTAEHIRTKPVSRERWVALGISAYNRGLMAGLVCGGILGACLAVLVWVKLMGCD